MIDCVLLAGGKGERFGDSECKPLAEIAGKPMVEYVLDAIAATKSIEDVVLVMDPDKVPERLKSRCLMASPGEEIDRSIENGLNCLHRDKKVLLITADTPLITAAMIESFVSVSVRSRADLTMPIVQRYVYEDRFPNSKRHYARLGDGREYTLGNMSLISPWMLDKNTMALIALAAGRRKSVLRLAGLIGIGSLIDMVLNRLDLDKVLRAISKKMGFPVQAIEVFSPEVAYDVDTIEHLEAIRGLLEH